MKVSELLRLLEELSPLAHSEEFDNTGLLVGNADAQIIGILITHDTLEDVVQEAVDLGQNVIVSFHPIIFSGLKKLTAKTYVERAVMKAIRHDIAIIAVHTALDNSWNGVNAGMCDHLKLENRSVLLPKSGLISKLTTYVPKGDAHKVREALFNVGCGQIGNYSHCSFNIMGEGTFMGNDQANPTVGEINELHHEPEVQIGVTFPSNDQAKVMTALFKSHPYEQVAYEITRLENPNQYVGMGMVGELPEPLEEEQFLDLLKTTFQTPCVRHSALIGNKISKVAVLGGSGSFAISAASRAGAQAYVTADLKYHDFYQAEGRLLLCDVGHFESERFTTAILFDFISKKIANFAPALSKGIAVSKVKTNPILYY